MAIEIEITRVVPSLNGRTSLGRKLLILALRSALVIVTSVTGALILTRTLFALDPIGGTRGLMTLFLATAGMAGGILVLKVFLPHLALANGAQEVPPSRQSRSFWDAPLRLGAELLGAGIGLAAVWGIAGSLLGTPRSTEVAHTKPDVSCVCSNPSRKAGPELVPGTSTPTLALSARPTQAATPCRHAEQC